MNKNPNHVVVATTSKGEQFAVTLVGLYGQYGTLREALFSAAIYRLRPVTHMGEIIRTYEVRRKTSQSFSTVEENGRMRFHQIFETVDEDALDEATLKDVDRDVNDYLAVDIK